MRYRDHSGLQIHRSLWTALAHPLGLDGRLPGALNDDLEMYSGNSLRVSVRPTLDRDTDHPSGTYTYGHISLFPCPKCTRAFLTCVYLHELFHAWLHQNRRRAVYVLGPLRQGRQFLRHRIRTIGWYNGQEVRRLPVPVPDSLEPAPPIRGLRGDTSWPGLRGHSTMECEARG